MRPIDETVLKIYDVFVFIVVFIYAEFIVGIGDIRSIDHQDREDHEIVARKDKLFPGIRRNGKLPKALILV